jgi:hypothetical protein
VPTGEGVQNKIKNPILSFINIYSNHLAQSPAIFVMYKTKEVFS